MCSTLDLVTLAFAATGVAPASFQDKTLVVWAAPANLTQRGGSVLTLEDPRDHFDAIVFGELRPACWMAGSDSFLRTQKDQANYEPLQLLRSPRRLQAWREMVSDCADG